jgi:hypothetical protein
MKKIIQTSLAVLISFALTAQSYRHPLPISHTEELNEQYCTGLFKTTDGTILDVMNEPFVNGYSNILSWLQGRVAGLQIYTTRNGELIPYIRASRARIFIDEMPVEANFLNAIPVSDIAMIKVIKTPFVGSFGAGSAIAIYTIRAEEDEEIND